MELVGIISEDFVNYKKPAMVLEFPYCTFKCDKECGERICQNGPLAAAPIIQADIEKIVQSYVNNPITQAIVFQGLEPFDSWADLLLCIDKFRLYTQDDIVIYTGFKENEISEEVRLLQKSFKNIIIKYGRFIPYQESHYDEVLGVKLASSNQYAVKIS